MQGQVGTLEDPEVITEVIMSHVTSQFTDRDPLLISNGCERSEYGWMSKSAHSKEKSDEWDIRVVYHCDCY